MPIDLRTVGGPSKATSPKRSSARSRVGPFENQHTAKAESDAVHYTDAGSILKNAEALVAAMPVVDAGRVSSITGLLENRSYVVNAERVAEKIIEFEQQLPG
jgi:negative regulator of flagellin synthesis FlgM